MTDYFCHPSAIVETEKIGPKTRVWAYAHILPGASLGEDCNICDHTYIENDVRLGDRVTVKSGVQLWDGITVENDVFIGPNATFDNDPFPRSKQYPQEFTRTTLREGCSIGANATILPGVTIGQHAMIGVGCVITEDVPPYAIVEGNPARITGYVDSKDPSSIEIADPVPASQLPKMKIEGVELIELPTHKDLAGSLTFGEEGQHLPFAPKRYFTVYDVPSREVRGGHAHRCCHQFLICINGSVSVVVDDGHRRQEIELDRPDLGIHVPPMVWATEYKYSPDAVLLVLASDSYDACDYIRNYDDYLKALSE